MVVQLQCLSGLVYLLQDINSLKSDGGESRLVYPVQCATGKGILAGTGLL